MAQWTDPRNYRIGGAFCLCGSAVLSPGQLGVLWFTSVELMSVAGLLIRPSS